MHSDKSSPGTSRPTVTRASGIGRMLGGGATPPRATAAPATQSSGPFAARYSDGRSAVARDAEVRIGDRGLAITIAETGARLLWPLASLRTAQPLGRHSRDVLVGRIGDEAETLFVADAAFAPRLAAVAPALTARSQRWRHARPWLLVGGTVALAAFAIARLELSPARAIAQLLPDSARARMGDEAIRSMTKGRRVCTTSEGRAALDRLTQRLSASLPADAPRFKVVVVDWSLMNAFAVPGGQIVLTRGLVQRTESPDEVAGVLAHEMGHGIELHPETGMVRALGMTAVADLLFGSGTMTNVGILLAQLSYSRDAERQADKQGLTLLKKAGIAPQGLAAFFRRIMKMEPTEPKSALPGRSLDVLSSHPATEERTRMVERQAPYPSTSALSPEDWQALRAICGSQPAVAPTPAKPAPAPDAKGGTRTTPKPQQPPPLPQKPPAQKAPPAPKLPAPDTERPIDL